MEKGIKQQLSSGESWVDELVRQDHSYRRCLFTKTIA
jgi:hypothetical protein